MFVKALQNSDLLIHAESFDNEFKQIVKNSISTKIADSLASGVPIVAYGPEGIASIDYLIKNEQPNASFFIDNKTTKLALKMLKNGKINLLGSDSHNITDRAPNLKECVEIIRKNLGDEVIEMIGDLSDEILLNAKNYLNR